MFPFNMFGELIPRTFTMDYRCYSVSMLSDREELERGGKIIMPPSALEILTRLNINYPMLFKLTNKKINRVTHCGVLEFVADENKVYLPYWMMRHLLIDEGDPLNVESVALPVATFSRFQPQSEDFLDITNPKAVLENCLRSFACLTTGDIIAINYNSRLYELCVLETKPGNAVTIIECDMNVDFAAPVGYQEPTHNRATKDEEMAVDEEFEMEHLGFVPFGGSGNRLDGKKRKQSCSDDKTSRVANYHRGIPEYNYVIGSLRFIRNARSANQDVAPAPAEDFSPFKGPGFTLRKSIQK